MAVKGLVVVHTSYVTEFVDQIGWIERDNKLINYSGFVLFLKPSPLQSLFLVCIRLGHMKYIL